MQRLGRLLIAAMTAGVLTPAVAAVAPAMAAGPTTAPGTDQGSIGIRLAEAPSDRASDPRAKIYIVDHVAPGTAIKRQIEVSNDSKITRRIQLYAAGADVASGQFTFRVGREANELSQWMKVMPAQLDLAAGTKGTAEVSIKVPAKASAGERYAVVWAETSTPAGVGQVSVVNRVGVRTYLSVGAGGEPASSFVISELTARRRTDGKPAIEAKVKNTGGRAVQLSGQLQLTEGPGGLSAGPFPVETGTTVGPGQSAVVEVVLDASMPLGPWNAKLLLQSGTAEAPASAQVSFPAQPGDTGKSVMTKAGEGAGSGRGASGTPIVLAGSAAALIAVAVLLVVVLKRRRRDEQGSVRRAVAEPGT
jgi:hypothetical protein